MFREMHDAFLETMTLKTLLDCFFFAGFRILVRTDSAEWSAGLASWDSALMNHPFNTAGPLTLRAIQGLMCRHKWVEVAFHKRRTVPLHATTPRCRAFRDTGSASVSCGY